MIETESLENYYMTYTGKTKHAGERDLFILSILFPKHTTGATNPEVDFGRIQRKKKTVMNCM